MASDDTIGNRLRRGFEGFGDDPEAAIAEIEDLYDPEMRFRDPLQTLSSLDAFLEMNRDIAARFPGSAIAVETLCESDTAVFMSWRMTLPQRIGPTLEIEGVTHCVVRDGLVVEHRDHWDLLGSMLGSIPVVSTAYRALLARIA